jgi:hypothetical protein
MASAQVSRKVNCGTGQLPVLDLGTQLESLFDTVWRSERIWNLEDRIDRNITLDLWRNRQAEAHGRASREEYGIGNR